MRALLAGVVLRALLAAALLAAEGFDRRLALLGHGQPAWASVASHNGARM